MKIAVASKNETKITAVRDAVRDVFDLQFADEPQILFGKVESGVSDQPVGLEETALGAENRAKAALAFEPGIEVSFGLEGGVVEVAGRYIDFGVAYVIGRSGLYGVGMSQGVTLSEAVTERIKSGVELSDALEQLYGVDTVATRDCSGFITDGRLPASLLYYGAVREALRDYIDQVECGPVTL